MVIPFENCSEGGIQRCKFEKGRCCTYQHIYVLNRESRSDKGSRGHCGERG
jgi:hypothetical protein